MPKAAWEFSEQTSTYTWKDFTVTPSNSGMRPMNAVTWWAATHGNLEVTAGPDLLEAMDYCENIQKRMASEETIT